MAYSQARDDLHVCKLCGLEYHSCDSCIKNTYLYYREVCDTELHFHIYQIIYAYLTGEKSKDQCAVELSKFELPDLNTILIEKNQNTLKEILDIQEIEVVQEVVQEVEKIIEESVVINTAASTGIFPKRKNKKL